MDYKEYARQMRENVVKDENGIIRVSPELWQQIASVIESIGTPTADVVEVVRCKNCQNNNGEEGICDNIYCTLHKGWFDKDAFCSYGEMALKEREKE